MTRFKALFIKLLRVKYEYTWRAVQRELDARYVFNKPFNSLLNHSGNQIDGIINCTEAMKYLNETVEDGWN
jgi:hypothetical protein